MKHIKLFDTHEDYLEYINSSDKIIPNISCCNQENHIHFNKLNTTVIAKFNIINTNFGTRIYGYQDEPLQDYILLSGSDIFQSIKVDGELISIEELDENKGKFQFDTTGEHIVEYVFKDTKSIADGAFQYCERLFGITIPNSVNTIGTWAFQNCLNLGSWDIDISECLMTIGFQAFFYCRNLTLFEIPSSVININNGAFSFSGLRYIEIPETVTNLGTDIFDSCEYLEEVVLPNNLKRIPKGMFFSCSNLTNITIPNGVTNIGENAFGYCSYLLEIVLPDSVREIGQQAFEHCDLLKRINIPNGVNALNARTFWLCSNLEEISIPNSVMYIYNQCFYGCSSLTNITIPSNVRSIDTNVFKDCSGLDYIIFERTTPPKLTNANTFTNTNDCLFYVPVESVDAYKTANIWSQFANRIVTNVK